MTLGRYSVSIAQRTPQAIGAPTYTELGPVIADGLSWTEVLNRAGSATATVTPRTMEPAVIEAFTEYLNDDSVVPGLELWMHRDATRVFRGPIIGVSITGKGDNWALRAAGPLYYTRYMYLILSTAFQADQFEIAAALIDQWQSALWGDFGLDTSGIGTSGVSRERTYHMGDNIYQRLIELSEVINGFEIWVDPVTLAVNLGTKGVDKTATVVLDRRAIADAGLHFSHAAGDLASHALAMNNDLENQLSTVASNTDVRNSFGRTGVVGVFDGVTQQSTMIEHAVALNVSRIVPMITPQPRVIPVEGAGPLDFETGDKVQFVPNVGIKDLVYNRRVLTKRVTVSANGVEAMGVEYE